ncbi:Rtg1p KNAG_0K01790 [Huiozyma naganishii CBS 8797]|uniref:BHLH domain-containing protein n=1 Tax=Huiozyma naganishii (strain ATCC MYA-139 / BCRC 22969 / CBS 8797 / KCTC 17520 / NBRC 10181 / NCYC 3082 / Yp74L-3) TaxID=1071383 RepID=J7SA91_HUIN7|nr:hypothetical protein KNAG_0K01790 [Kazachstania naganishii CBS 8797]CCK72544.1 hypothetical protein KNAG_0K01790 [Kazachstania naganishii CBS 8797]
MNTIPEAEPSSVTSSSSFQTFQNDRKRRDNINERIQELLQLIPREYFQEYYNGSKDLPPPEEETPNASKLKGTGTRDGKPNKGQILTQAVEYITQLQNEVDSRNREEVELMLKVQKLGKTTGTLIDDINLEDTSAEIELSRIGVGPLAGDGNDRKPAKPQTQPQQSQPHQSFEYGGYSEYN